MSAPERLPVAVQTPYVQDLAAMPVGSIIEPQALVHPALVTELCLQPSTMQGLTSQVHAHVTSHIREVRQSHPDLAAEAVVVNVRCIFHRLETIRFGSMSHQRMRDMIILSDEHVL
jgi:hypothetical protein